MGPSGTKAPPAVLETHLLVVLWADGLLAFKRWFLRK